MRVFILFTLFIIICSNIYAQSERKFIRKGNREFREENYDNAEIQYRKALEKAPGSDKAEYNLAGSLYKQEKFEAAATKYMSIAGEEEDKETLARYYYNFGNALFRENKLEESIEAYKKSLINNPDDADAKHNLALANRMKQQQQQQNQQQDQQKDQDQDSQEDEQQQQQEQEQQQQEQQQDQNQQAKPQPEQISREDAERLLEALEQEEKDVLKKLEEEKSKARKVPVEKNW